MAPMSTFYLSRVIGNRVYSSSHTAIGKLVDLVVDVGFVRPKTIAAKVKMGKETKLLDFNYFGITKDGSQYVITCQKVREIQPKPNMLFLVKNVLDKQIVDMDGRKLVRVNDLRLAPLSHSICLVAVDVGLEGLLRRLGIAKPVNRLLSYFGRSIPSKLILWDDVETIDYSHAGIKLSKSSSKLSTLHPSDLADIIEDLDRKTQVAVFSSLDEEQAADVLEELETDAQINVLGSLPLGKAADVLEKMPADEVADILDEMEDDRAEELLSEMEAEASEDVRELMEYPSNTVGSLMTMDHIAFHQDMTVNETINELRKLKPEPDTIYDLYIVDARDRLVATVSLRDIVISEPETRLSEIMDEDIIFVHDQDKVDSLAEIISKYGLFAVPVVDHDMTMMGMVIINDVVYDLLRTRRRRR